MTMPEIKAKARDLGLKPGKMRKAALIHAIQQAEGNMQCYKTAEGHCPNADCCFITDCLSGSC